MTIPLLLFSYFKCSELERLSKTLADIFQFNETELPSQYERWRALLNSSEKGGFPGVAVLPSAKGSLRSRLT